jgi:photosynthetic reaction center H subunit
MNGAITSYIDVAQIALYLFWAFFAGLIYYLHREDKREGYPLENERSPFVTVRGWPNIPKPKTFNLADGTVVLAPRAEPRDLRPVNARPYEKFPGAPIVPNGDPLADGIGPAAYAQRADIPDTTVHGTPKIVPLRQAEGYYLDSRDPNPMGMTVVGADGQAAGVVRDVWVDRAEYLIRYFEVEVGDTAKKRNVLLPANLTRIGSRSREIYVHSILGRHFASVPAHRKPDMVTRLEEDRIQAYYGGGNLYATPQRAEPLI